jgi:glycerophosphoryl diester phosphodiesterase
LNASRDADDWLIARPIAHRGLHDVAKGIVENTLAAAQAAIAKNYAIECDLQLSRDGEAIAFHDETLTRLVGIDGDIGAYNAADLTALRYQGADATIATFGDLLDTIAGRVPLIVELKSRFDGDERLVARAAALAEAYAGPLAFQSFDPQMPRRLRATQVTRPLGLIGEAGYRGEDWPEPDAAARARLAGFDDLPEMQLDFLAWNIRDLPHAVPLRCRAEHGLKILAWTVRTAADRTRAGEWADQIIFEGFDP